MFGWFIFPILVQSKIAVWEVGGIKYYPFVHYTLLVHLENDYARYHNFPS